MSASNRPAWRQIDASDPGVDTRLGRAWRSFERVLDQAGVASDLDVEDLDYVIIDLLAIRHRCLHDLMPDDTVRTTFTQRDRQLTLDSYAIDRFGIERSLRIEPSLHIRHRLEEEDFDGP